MARKSSKSRSGKAAARSGDKPQGRRGEAAPPKGRKGFRERRRLPNWPVLVLALAGFVLAAFLSVTAWSQAQLPYCEAGSACDVVQGSRWAWLLGAPIAFWGMLTYGLLAWIAARVKHSETHWKSLFTVSLVGLGLSVYLTVIAAVELQATCGYCIASLAVMAALFGVVCAQFPRGLPEFAWPTWLAQTGGVLLVALVAFHVYHSDWLRPGGGKEDPYLKALAQHLGEVDATFYGAQWCGNCERQKEMFEASAYRLPYVECSPGGRNAPQAPICGARGIDVYPTWIIGGQRFEGVLPPERLARITDFTFEQAAR